MVGRATYCGRCGSALNGSGPGALCASCLLESALEGSPDSGEVLGPKPLHSFGDYQFLGEIARGGMGVVYRARQISLNRTVAVKMILAGRLAGAAEVARFRMEAETAARLQHPGIVAIHGIGEHEGCQYFSMDYVEGRTLTEIVRDQPLPAQRAARYARGIAEAIHYSHTQGVLHRDLKPSNVIVDDADQPRVTDFGLAKWLEGKSDLTLSGQVLGSPSFMPPEQAGAKERSVGPWSDVYSIGAILYHLLTGRPPFSAETATATLRMVMEVEPVAPRLLNATVPRDLETICLKCLEKEAKRRYSSARELADELARFLDGKAIRARPVGMLEAGHRWARRHPLVATLTGAVGLLLVAVALISTTAATQLQRANREGREHLREAYLAQAQANRWSQRQGRRFDSLGALGKAAAIRTGLDLRNEAIAAMTQADLRPVKTWDIPLDCQHVFDRAYEHYARTETNGTVVVRRVRDEVEIARWPGDGKPVNGVRFSPNGRFLGVHHRGGRGQFSFYVYDLHQGGKLWFEVPDRWIRNFLFSEDGRWLVMAWAVVEGGENLSSITFYDMPTGREHSCFPVAALPYGMALNPEGTRLAVSSEQTREVHLHSVPTGQIEQSLVHSNGVASVSWSRDGRRLATACLDHQYYIWGFEGATLSVTLLSQDDVARECWFSPRGDRLLTSAWDHTVRLWTVLQPGKEPLRFAGDGTGAFSDDGRWVQIRFTPYSTSLCEYSAADEARVYTFEPGGCFAAVLSPDGRWMASGHRDGLRLWNLDGAGNSHHIPLAETRGLRFTADGRWLITAGAGGVVRWPVSTRKDGKQNRVSLGPPQTMDVTLLPVGHSTNRSVVVAQGKAWIFDSDAFRAEHTIVSTQSIYYAEMNPAQTLCATYAWASRRIYVWDAASGSLVTNLPASTTPCLGFSRDGRWLVSGSADEYVFWDVRTWTQGRRLKRGITGGSHGRMAFTPDGETMALSTGRGQVGLYNARTFEVLAILDSSDGRAISSLDFSTDGAHLLVSSAGPEIRRWDLRLIRQQLTKLNLDYAAPTIPPGEGSSDPIEFNVAGPP